MPPHLTLSRPVIRLLQPPQHTSAASLLRPFLQQAQQCRSASILSSLSDTAGAYNRRIRRGRGPSSGKGKTSGRGHNGQKQHGSVPVGFQGGQTREEVVHGERGFENDFSLEMSPINVSRIQQWIDAGRLDPSLPITLKELNSSRCLHGIKDGVKLLARGAEALTSPIHIVVSRASAAAISAVESAGGSVTTRYYTKPAIQRVVRGKSHPYHSMQSRPLPYEVAQAAERGEQQSLVTVTDTSKFEFRLPDATSRKDIEYYRDPAHRGYLSYMVDEGQGPSLFFKTPQAGRMDRRQAAGKGGKNSAKAANRIW